MRQKIASEDITADFPSPALTTAWEMSVSARTGARVYSPEKARPLYAAIDQDRRYHGRGDTAEVIDGV